MANQQQTVKLAQKVMRHMHDMSAGHQVGSILLAGDPGIGKTTMVALLASLLGMKAVVIEIPHITEEHLINIPFLVFDSSTGKQTHGSTNVDTSKMSMTLADSNLFSLLQSAKALTDAEYLKYIEHAPMHVQQVYTQMGGTATKIPEAIQQARSRHSTILFLDEFYRQSSMRIRNIMRGILNGNIGMHKIPKNVYIMYASNMRDSGLESEIPSNHQFTVVEYKPPKKDDWFVWLASKYENHTHIKLNHNVIKKFAKLLDDQDISYDDYAVGVRTSPRRWEQLITYINTALPVQSTQEARALLTNVKNNFIHYQDETHSSLAEKVTKAVSELIQETSNLDVAHTDTLAHHEWRDALDHAVLQIERSGGDRKHIPVVSGPPGIGKTSQAWQVAADHNLRLIEIDVSELFAEDAVGMPLPGERNGKQIKVTFSAPKLYKQIMDLIEQKDQAYIDQLAKEHGPEATQKLAEYKKQPFKYLILLDELNRVDQKTFNALRRVILEKNFGGHNDETGDEYKLPKSAIVIGAINPHGAGTEELTSHFRDVIDVIPAKASWKDTKKWLGAKEMKHIQADVKTSAMSIMDAFANKFGDKKNDEHQRAFYLDIGVPLYISPREYSDMYATMTRELNARYDMVMRSDDIDEQGIRPELDDAAYEALEDSLNMIFYKQNPDMKDEFLHKLKTWIEQLPPAVYGPLLKKTAAGIESFSSTLEKYLDGHDLAKMPDDAGIINANNTINHDQFIQEVKDTLVNKIVDDETVKKYILNHDHAKLNYQDEDLVPSGDKTSLLENFFLCLLYSLHINGYANDRLMVVGKSLSHMMSDLRKNWAKTGKVSEDVEEQATESTIGLRSDLTAAIKKL